VGTLRKSVAIVDGARAISARAADGRRHDKRIGV